MWKQKGMKMEFHIQERSERVYSFYRGIFFVLLMLPLIISCNKKAIVSSNLKETDNNMEAAFNYLFTEGVRQKLMGNPAEALKNFEQCVQVNPESDASFYEIAEIMISNGNLNTGKDYLKRAVALNEKNISYMSILASVYYEQKNLDSSIICLERVILYYPEKDDIRLQLGNLYSEKGDYAKAVSTLDYLDTKFGVNETSTVLKIKNLMLLGDYSEAEKSVLVLLVQYPDELLYNGLLAEIYGAKGESEKALNLYNQLLEKNPENSQVQLSLIDYLDKEKQYDDLVSFLNTVTINSNIDKNSKVSLFMSLLEDSVLIGSYSSGLEISTILLESQYNDDEMVTLVRPELYTKMGRFAEAISKLEDHVKMFPENYYGWERLLLLYSETEDYEKLYTRGKECAAKFNLSILPKLLYASGATEMKDYNTALEELKKVRILANEDKNINPQILSMEADVYYRMGDFKNSFTKYDELLKTDPDNMGILNNYAYFLAEQNMNLKAAEQMSKRTIIAEKDNETFLDTYAWILYKKGSLKEAAKIMENIILNSNPSDAEYYEHYGYILKGLNRCEEAITYMEMAIKIDNKKQNLIKEISDCQEKR
jgi:tetratricopeptide (TPR) repeat protein